MSDISRSVSWADAFGGGADVDEADVHGVGGVGEGEHARRAFGEQLAHVHEPPEEDVSDPSIAFHLQMREGYTSQVDDLRRQVSQESEFSTVTNLELSQTLNTSQTLTHKLERVQRAQNKARAVAAWQRAAVPRESIGATQDERQAVVIQAKMKTSQRLLIDPEMSKGEWRSRKDVTHAPLPEAPDRVDDMIRKTSKHALPRFKSSMSASIVETTAEPDIDIDIDALRAKPISELGYSEAQAVVVAEFKSIDLGDDGEASWQEIKQACVRTHAQTRAHVHELSSAQP